MSDPDYLYDPDNWECTYEWETRVEAADDAGMHYPCEIKRFCTLLRGPDKFAVKVPTAWDEDGNPEDWELEFFDSADDARAACKRRT